MKPPRPQYTSEGSFASGCLWLILMSILIGWIPVIGHFLAGFIAGRKSGGVGTAILVVLSFAIIPAVIVAVLATSYFGAEAGAISGGVVVILLAAGLGIELLGAIVGGATIQRHPVVQAVQMYPPPPGQAQYGPEPRQDPKRDMPARELPAARQPQGEVSRYPAPSSGRGPVVGGSAQPSSQPARCSNCGRVLKPNWKYCPYCRD